MALALLPHNLAIMSFRAVTSQCRVYRASSYRARRSINTRWIRSITRNNNTVARARHQFLRHTSYQQRDNGYQNALNRRNAKRARKRMA